MASPAAAEALAGLRRDPSYWKLKQEVKEAVLGLSTIRKEVPTAKAVESLVAEHLRSCRAAVLDNEVLRRTQAVSSTASPLPAKVTRTLAPSVTAPPSAREPIDFLRAQQAEWRRKLVKRFNRIAKTKSGPVVAGPREPEFRSMKWETLLDLITEAPLDAGMYLYDAVDVLREAIQAEDPNFSAGGFRVMAAASRRKDGVVPSAARPWGLIKVQFYVPSLGEFRNIFDGLSLDKPQVGVDLDPAFLDRRETDGSGVLARGLVREAATYLQRGAPNHVRPAMWELSLDIGSGPALYGAAYIDELRNHVARYDLFVDRLIAADVKRLANADDCFFVFEDVVKEVLLLLARDARVDGSKACPVEPCLGSPRGGSTSDVDVQRYPPSGVLPFRGMAYYVAPLCYLYGDATRAYHVAFALYTRYFCLLHSVSSAPNGLLRMACVFEQLLQSQDPTLFGHLVMIGLDPVTVAAPWIMMAFSGVLPPDQTLLLWDRIIGFNTLLVLPITAVAIFRFRRNQLLNVTTVKQAEKLLTDCVALNATALLQFSLFGDPLARNATSEK